MELLEKLKEFAPDVVIHTAWQISHMYGDEKTEWEWNIDFRGCNWFG